MMNHKGRRGKLHRITLAASMPFMKSTLGDDGQDKRGGRVYFKIFEDQLIIAKSTTTVGSSAPTGNLFFGATLDLNKGG